MPTCKRAARETMIEGHLHPLPGPAHLHQHHCHHLFHHHDRQIPIHPESLTTTDFSTRASSTPLLGNTQQAQSFASLGVLCFTQPEAGCNCQHPDRILPGFCQSAPFCAHFRNKQRVLTATSVETTYQFNVLSQQGRFGLPAPRSSQQEI